MLIPLLVFSSQQTSCLPPASPESSSFTLSIRVLNPHHFNNLFYEQDINGLSRGIKIIKFLNEKLNYCRKNIIRTDLVFSNGKIIGKLRERGRMIKGEDFEGVERVEREI